MSTETMSRVEEYVKGLHDLADFLQEHPSMIGLSGVSISRWYWLPRDAVEFRDALAALGPATKERFSESSTLTGLSRTFGPHTFSVVADRDKVCTRRQVGWTEEVDEVKLDEIGENEEPIEGTEAWVRVVKVTRKTPKYEVTCPDSLLARASELAAQQ